MSWIRDPARQCVLTALEGALGLRALGLPLAITIVSIVFVAALATMLPYSVAFIIAWTALLLTWWGLGLPLGVGAP